MENFTFISREGNNSYLAVNAKNDYFTIKIIKQLDQPSTNHYWKVIQDIRLQQFSSICWPKYVFSDTSGKLMLFCFQKLPSLEELQENYKVSVDLGFYLVLDLVSAIFSQTKFTSVFSELQDSEIYYSKGHLLMMPLELVQKSAECSLLEVGQQIVHIYCKLVFEVDGLTQQELKQQQLPKLISKVLDLLTGGKFAEIMHLQSVEKIMQKRLPAAEYGSIYARGSRLDQVLDGYHASFLAAYDFEGSALEELLMQCRR